MLWSRSYFACDFVTWVHDSPGPTRWLRQIVDLRSSGGGLEIDYLHSPVTDADGIARFRKAAAREPSCIYVNEPSRGYPWRYSAYPNPSVFH